MTQDEFNNLREGDIVRGKGSDLAYIVTDVHGGRVTAVRTADITNPAEWDVVGQRPKSLSEQFRIDVLHVDKVNKNFRLGGLAWPSGVDVDGVVIDVREKQARRLEIWLNLHEESPGVTWFVDRKTMVATRNPAAASASLAELEASTKALGAALSRANNPATTAAATATSLTPNADPEAVAKAEAYRDAIGTERNVQAAMCSGMSQDDRFRFFMGAPAHITPPTFTHKVTTNADLVALHLSFYSLVKLAEVLNCVDPTLCLEHRLTHPAFADKGWKGELTLDALGNFVSFK